MFGSTDKKESSNSKSKSTASASSHSLNTVVNGTAIEGTVKAKSDIRIDGAIKGELFCDAKVIIGPTGFVDGKIKCKNAVIEGKFNGTLNVSELLNIREKADVNGDISTDKLIVASGAIFNVNCIMGGGQKGHNPIAADKQRTNVVKTGKATGA